MFSHKSLNREERFLWECARQWRQPELLVAASALDWNKVVEIGKWNRMQTLLLNLLKTTGQLDELPSGARVALEEDAGHLHQTANAMSEALHEYLVLAARQHLDTVVLKGLSLSLNVYGDAAMRPGGDIDLLVRTKDVASSLAILDDMGLGQWWPNLLADAYYYRHHLHQQRCTQDWKLWFEVHWALDHPYTLLTVDYEAMMDRSTAGMLLSAPVNDLAPPDLLLSVAIHLVKHAVYLPSVLERPDLTRIILADGLLMYFLDVAEVVKTYANDLDWKLTVELARESGAVDILGSVLQVCQRYLDTPVPEWVLASLTVEGPGRLVRKTMQRMADYEVNRYLGRDSNRLWNFLLDTNGAFILRPIRILDTVAYFFPGADYQSRRYGVASPLTGARHFLRASGQYVRLGVDTIYYTGERYRRLKRLNHSTSLFNRLEVEE